MCSTICADEEEVSTNEGEEADDADEEEDGAECSMFKEISTECVCLIYMDLVRNTVILLHYFWRFLVRNRDKLQDMPD